MENEPGFTSLSLGTSPIGDCMKYLNGTSSYGPAYLLAFTSVTTLFHISIFAANSKL